MAASGGGGSVVAGYGGRPGHGRVSVPRHDRVSGPEAGIRLLAPGARQPAEGVDAPAGFDRADAGVGLPECRGIGVRGDARPHLTPHHWYPQLITDYGPLGTCGAGGGLSPRGSLSSGGSLSPGGGLSPVGSLGSRGSFSPRGSLSPVNSLSPVGSLSPGGSLSPRGSLGPRGSLSPGGSLSPVGFDRNFLRRIVVAPRLGVAVAHRVGAVIVSEGGEPIACLAPVAVVDHAGVV